MEKKEGTHACFLLGSPLINSNTVNKESNSQHSKKDRPSLETISSVTGRLRYKTALPRKESRGKTERKRREEPKHSGLHHAHVLLDGQNAVLWTETE